MMLTNNSPLDDTSSSQSPVDQPALPEGEPQAPANLSGDSRRQIHLAVAAAEARKAEDLKVLKLADVSDFTDYFFLCSGNNERQVQAIADEIVRRLRKQGVKPLHVEGQQRGHWILLDYGGDMVIHVFLDETRQFYNLEGLWSDAPNETETFKSAS